tara:strand:- start:236 stop:526 length:291 start_codon:yes stop_codon:yes gene_type:complete
MKNLGKELNKVKKQAIKLSKEDIEKISPEKVLKDLTSVDKVLQRLEGLDTEKITKKDVGNIESELKIIEKYLKTEYKDYIDADLSGFDEKDLDIKK